MAERQLFAVVVLPVHNEWVLAGGELIPCRPIPSVVGPFRTSVQARRSAEREWDPTKAQWAVVPMQGYWDAKDERISLSYDRVLDPQARDRCPACKQKVKDADVKR